MSYRHVNDDRIFIFSLLNVFVHISKIKWRRESCYRIKHLSCYRMLLITFCQKLICSGWFLKRPLSGSVIHMEPLEPARPQPPYIPINGKKGWEGVLDSDRCSLIVILHPYGYSSFHICRHRLSDCSAPQHKLNTLCLEGTCAKNTSACSTLIFK